MSSTLFRPIDLTTPGALDDLFAYHRAIAGDVRMEEGAGADTDAGTTDQGDAAVGAGAAAGTSRWNPDAWDGKVESLPPAAQKLLADARADAGKARTTAKQQAADEARQQLAQDVAKALGIVKDDDTLTPEQLQKQLADEAAARASEADATKNLQREHQVLRSAIKAGADHERLLDSRAFLAKVADLDPTAEDFTTKVDDAVKAALTADPTLKAARAAGKSSVDHPGGTGEGAAKPTNLEEAILQRMTQ